MDAEVAAAMTQLESDQGRGEEASLESDVQKENAERAMGAQTTENAKTEKNANSLQSSPARVRPPRARRAGARSVGPALGSGVFGAREASAALPTPRWDPSEEAANKERLPFNPRARGLVGKKTDETPRDGPASPR